MFSKRLYFYLVGILFLFLAKSKNVIKGYSTPKPIDISNTKACIDYDVEVVTNWLKQLKKYTKEENPVLGKNILELGPGSDLGIGLYLLSQGCIKYNALDVNELAAKAPPEFYKSFFKHLKKANTKVDVEFLKQELAKTQKGKPDKLNYLVRDDFDLTKAFKKAFIDIIFSQAAFEHFDNIDETVSRLSKICKPGAVIVAEIDLMTHSRYVRDKDPNNIYRYPEWLYNIFRFRGIPNRVRPYEYRQIFEKHGWTDVEITPRVKTSKNQMSYDGVHKKYRNLKNKMEYLSIVLCARYKK